MRSDVYGAYLLKTRYVFQQLLRHLSWDTIRGPWKWGAIYKFVSLLSLFWKKEIEVGLCDLYSICEPSHISVWVPKPVCMKLGMCSMAPHPISTAYFINLSHQSVCLYVCMCIHPFIARQRLGKHITAAANTRNNRRIIGCVCLCVCVSSVVAR
jgi:hypothetical protein